ncbi:class I adenylate-forming enzyme family protein [Nocardia vaccinii]|uniref:class I adenylate-forming enzyme family protein n=1 Tax=Nocardia vaccinii TaxID=1822 RepID=UPI00082B3ABB|nr:AMP-binding protein [Nocardia vaccinii]
MHEAPNPTTYWELVASAAENYPDRVVLLDEYGRRLTSRQLRDAACSTAAWLAGHGIASGTVVSWQLPTTLETMVIMTALARLGAVQNPIIPLLRESELGFITAQISAEFLLVPETWRGFPHGDLARSLAAKRGLAAIIVDHETTPAASGLRLPAGDPGRLPAPPTPSADTRWIYYSSGTTAAPKGARHSDRSVIAGSAGVVGMVGATSEDVNPLAFPISHIGGAAMLAAALLTGMRLALFSSFDPANTPSAIAAVHPTLLGSATPFFVAFMATARAHGDKPLFPALRACVAGGAPITPELARQVREQLHVPGIANAWGLTEFPVATSPKPDAAPEVLDYTVGPPVPGVRVRVVDEYGNQAAVGQEGELRLRGPQCFLGYVDASLDAEAFDVQGWFRTGDYGLIDADGNVRVTGRIKDAIIRNAENISALEVEAVLITHPAVSDVAVIGVPDDRTGEKVCAVIVPEPDRDITLRSLVDHCRAHRLSRHKHPERLEVIDALPRNTAGKVLKNVLREQFHPSAPSLAE